MQRLLMLLLYGTPLLAVWAFSGISTFWVETSYDEWRLIEIVVLLLLSIYVVFSPTRLPSALSPTTHRYLSIGLLSLLGLLILSIAQAQHPARAMADAALYVLLAGGVWAQARLLKQKPDLAPHIAAVLALSPLFTLFFLPFSIASTIHTHDVMQWHLSFSNIRMFDDALLPCLFLLWQRPAWLAAHPKRNVFNHALTVAIYAISTLYFIAFWMDGARAGLLSIAVGLGIIALIRRDSWSHLRLPVLTLIGSGLIYTLLLQILPTESANTIMRTDSSMRDVLWLKALHLWQAHPLLGVGGNHFVLSNPWLLNAHPHNLPLQWISEWGIAGLLAMALLLPILWQIFRQRHTLPLFAFAAIAAVGTDAMLSGVLVYPLSQMLGLWSLAWLISLLPSHSLSTQLTTQSTVKQLYIRSHFQTWQRSFKIITVCAVIGILSIHGRDLICVGCASVDENNAPRFWQFGRALHLQKQLL